MNRHHLSLSIAAVFVGAWLCICHADHAHAHTPGQAQPRPSQWGTLRQTHKVVVEEFSSADAVLLYGVYPALIAGNAVLLTGNIVALARRKQTRAWGGIGLVVGILTILGGVPLLADNGVGWTMLPLGGGATLIALSIANLALGDTPTQTLAPNTPTKKAASEAPSPGVAQGIIQDTSLQRVSLGRW